MTYQDQWQIGIEGGLSAHFMQPDGTSLPGIDWSVALQRGSDEKQYVTVRSYLSADISESARADTDYQMRIVAGYVFDLLDNGWTPEQSGNLETVIQNPLETPGE